MHPAFRYGRLVGLALVCGLLLAACKPHVYANVGVSNYGGDWKPHVDAGIGVGGRIR